MNLVSEFGRYDRAAVQGRAREIRAQRGPMEWGEALTLAYREASDELRARFNPPSVMAIKRKVAA